jgi:HlyD family secretion protein
VTTRAIVALVVVSAAAASCGDRAGALRFVEVVRGDLVIGVEVTGDLEAVDSTDIKPPPVSGFWGDFKIAMLADEGVEVAAGEPIAAFDPSELIREMETMQNEAAEAKTKLAKKKNDAALARRDEALAIAGAEAALRKARLKADAPAELTASVQLRVVELDEELAEAALERAKNRAAQAERADAAELRTLVESHAYATHRVEQIEKNVARMTVMAPRAGTVVYPTSRWGSDKKKVGDSAWRLESVLQIVALGKMIGEGEVDEVDIARVEEGQQVSLRLDALPDVQLHGTVKSIARDVRAKSWNDPSKVVRLKIDVGASADVPLRPGMRFRGEVESARIPGLVLIPAEAVFVTPNGPVAYRKRGSDVELVALVLGRRSATMIEVVTGLAAGDQVSTIDPRGAP